MRLRVSSRSFTLVEVTVVIAIIGLLLSLITPMVHSVIAYTRRGAAVNYMHQIAVAVRQYMQDHGHPIRWKDMDTIDGNHGYSSIVFAALLDKYNYLKCADVWSWSFDDGVKSSGCHVPAMVTDSSGQIVSEYSNGYLPMSVNVICAGDGLSNDQFFDNGHLVPMLSSRGLIERTDSVAGSWSGDIGSDGSVWGSSGGLVAYFDGHVEWKSRCSFYKYQSMDQTNKLYEACPNGSTTADKQNTCLLSWDGISSL